MEEMTTGECLNCNPLNWGGSKFHTLFMEITIKKISIAFIIFYQSTHTFMEAIKYEGGGRWVKNH